MSVLINEAQEKFYKGEKHLYILEVTGTTKLTGKGSRTYKPVQITAINRNHAVDKARKLKGLKIIGAVTPLGRVKSELEQRYFRLFNKQLAQ